MITINTKITVNKMQKLMQELEALKDIRVLVGIPEEENLRRDEEDSSVGNALLAYVHDNGSPVRGIPARPFMKPGIARVQSKISSFMRKAAKAHLEGQMEEKIKLLHNAGMVAADSIRSVINIGEGFTPLKRATLLGRMRRREYLKNLSKEEREDIMDSFHPLVDTGQMRNAITYSIEGVE